MLADFAGAGNTAAVRLMLAAGVQSAVPPVPAAAFSVKNGSSAPPSFLVQLSLKHPDLYRFQAHRQSPLLSFFQSTSEVE